MVAHAPSYVNTIVPVPAMPAIVITESSPGPWPPLGRHTVDVGDTHDTVAQLLSPSRLLAVVSRAPKLMPCTVTLQPTVWTTLAESVKLTIGAESYILRWQIVPAPLK